MIVCLSPSLALYIVARFNVAAATEFVEALSHSARGDPLRDL